MYVERSKRSAPLDLGEVRESAGPPPKRAVPFGSHEELLEAGRRMLFARKALREAQARGRGKGRQDARLRERAAGWTRYWHECIAKTGDELVLTARCKLAGLDAIEHEIILVLVLNKLAVFQIRAGTPPEIVRALGLAGTEALQAYRALSDDGRLAQASLIFYDDADEDLFDRQVSVDPVLMEFILSGQSRRDTIWAVATEDEFHAKVSLLTRAFLKKERAFEAADLDIPGCTRGITDHPRWR